jgi:hypothetical protein
MANQLQILVSESAITKVIHLYSHALDRRRWELLDCVFHKDAKYGFGDISGHWHDFVRVAKSLVNPLGPTHHMVSNILIEIDGDVAQVETYLNGYHVVPADYPAGLNTNGLFYDRPGERYVSIVGGRYVDRFENRDGGWRIAQRAGMYDWIQILPYTDGGLSQSPDAALGKWGNSDPSSIVVKRLMAR